MVVLDNISQSFKFLTTTHNHVLKEDEVWFMPVNKGEQAVVSDVG